MANHWFPQIPIGEAQKILAHANEHANFIENATRNFLSFWKQLSQAEMSSISEDRYSAITKNISDLHEVWKKIKEEHLQQTSILVNLRNKIVLADYVDVTDFSLIPIELRQDDTEEARKRLVQYQAILREIEKLMSKLKVLVYDAEMANDCLNQARGRFVLKLSRQEMGQETKEKNDLPSVPEKELTKNTAKPKDLKSSQINKFTGFLDKVTSHYNGRHVGCSLVPHVDDVGYNFRQQTAYRETVKQDAKPGEGALEWTSKDRHYSEPKALSRLTTGIVVPELSGHGWLPSEYPRSRQNLMSVRDGSVDLSGVSYNEVTVKCKSAKHASSYERKCLACPSALLDYESKYSSKVMEAVNSGNSADIQDCKIEVGDVKNDEKVPDSKESDKPCREEVASGENCRPVEVVKSEVRPKKWYEMLYAIGDGKPRAFTLSEKEKYARPAVKALPQESRRDIVKLNYNPDSDPSYYDPVRVSVPPSMAVEAKNYDGMNKNGRSTFNMKRHFKTNDGNQSNHAFKPRLL